MPWDVQWNTKQMENQDEKTIKQREETQTMRWEIWTMEKGEALSHHTIYSGILLLSRPHTVVFHFDLHLTFTFFILEHWLSSSSNLNDTVH